MVLKKKFRRETMRNRDYRDSCTFLTRANSMAMFFFHMNATFLYKFNNLLRGKVTGCGKCDV